MKVSILGCGYVGLVTGACLADCGHDVICLDVDSKKVAQINSGKAPFFEEGLDEIISRNIGEKLTSSSDLPGNLNNADLILVCVGTPFDGENIDLRYITSAAKEIGEVIKNRDDYCVVVIKSTVIPGTTTGIFKDTIEKTSGKFAGTDFGLGMNPEFLAEGTAVKDFVNADRIVLGGIDTNSINALRELYATFDNDLLMETNPSTAEMIKYTSNSLLATLISFSNEIAAHCDLIENVDVAEVLKGVHKMQHLNYQGEKGEHYPVSAQKFLWAGCGFGGSCFPKDVKALTAFAKEKLAPSKLLESVIEINEQQPYKLIEIMTNNIPLNSIKKVAVLGTAFKPGTDDIRESPSLKIVEKLVELNINICCHDPIANENAENTLKDMGVSLDSVEFTEDLNSALNHADVVMLITSWSEYQEVPKKLSKLNNNALLIDGRRFIPPTSYENYCGIGY